VSVAWAGACCGYGTCGFARSLWIFLYSEKGLDNDLVGMTTWHGRRVDLNAGWYFA
jgi:hypothetical protein